MISLRNRSSSESDKFQVDIVLLCNNGGKTFKWYSPCDSIEKAAGKKVKCTVSQPTGLYGIDLTT
jgi:hypothetical protein